MDAVSLLLLSNLASTGVPNFVINSGNAVNNANKLQNAFVGGTVPSASVALQLMFWQGVVTWDTTTTQYYARWGPHCNGIATVVAMMVTSTTNSVNGKPIVDVIARGGPSSTSQIALDFYDTNGVHVQGGSGNNGNPITVGIIALVW